MDVSTGQPVRTCWLSDGESISLSEEEAHEILARTEERLAEWMARKKEELTEEEYQRIVIRFLEMVRRG